MCTSVIFRLSRIQSRVDTQTIEIFIVLSSEFRSTFPSAVWTISRIDFKVFVGTCCCSECMSTYGKWRRNLGLRSEPYLVAHWLLELFHGEEYFSKLSNMRQNGTGADYRHLDSQPLQLEQLLMIWNPWRCFIFPLRLLCVSAHIFPLYTSVDSSFINQLAWTTKICNSSLLILPTPEVGHEYKRSNLKGSGQCIKSMRSSLIVKLTVWFFEQTYL